MTFRLALSLTARISLLFALAAAAVLLAAGVLLARSVEAHFVESDRHELEGKLELIRHLIERADTPAAVAALPGQLDDALVGHHDLKVAVADAAGAVWYASPGAALPEDVLQGARCPGALVDAACLAGGVWQWRQDGKAYRGLAAAARGPRGEAHRIGAARDLAHHTEFMDGFRLRLALAMTLAALATAALGWVATRRGLSALRRFSDLAAGISAERLTTRLPEAGNPAELRDLARAFNAMLARLDDSFRRLSEFSSDIAHELRTPVSNLMTQTQVALSRARNAGEYREVLQSNAEEYERLARMVDDMLFLAQADNRLIVPRDEPVDLAAEARGLMEFHGLVAEERNVRLSLEGAATAAGDRLMLRRALSNLLSNAIRHCPDGGVVSVRLSQDEGARIEMENPGEIAAERLPRLFDRFYTGDPARHSGGGGVGLGLAIVRSIVEAHGGRAEAESGAGAVRFVLWLPAPQA